MQVRKVREGLRGFGGSRVRGFRVQVSGVSSELSGAVPERVSGIPTRVPGQSKESSETPLSRGPRRTTVIVLGVCSEGEELHHSAREETFVIIVSCIDSEVAAVKDAVRIHNKHRAPGLGKAGPRNPVEAVLLYHISPTCRWNRLRFHSS